jgi:hypothetical protein
VAARQCVGWQGTTHHVTIVAVISVRFVVQATPADITGFLATYKASIIREPRGVGFYRVRVSDAGSQEELSKLVARMGKKRSSISLRCNNDDEM